LGGQLPILHVALLYQKSPYEENDLEEGIASYVDVFEAAAEHGEDAASC